MKLMLRRPVLAPGGWLGDLIRRSCCEEDLGLVLEILNLKGFRTPWWESQAGLGSQQGWVMTPYGPCCRRSLGHRAHPTALPSLHAVTLLLCPQHPPWPLLPSEPPISSVCRRNVAGAQPLPRGGRPALHRSRDPTPVLTQDLKAAFCTGGCGWPLGAQGRGKAFKIK